MGFWSQFFHDITIAGKDVETALAPLFDKIVMQPVGFIPEKLAGGISAVKVKFPLAIFCGACA